MKKVTVYDIEAEILERTAEINNTTVAEIVEMLMDYFEDMKADNNLQ